MISSFRRSPGPIRPSRIASRIRLTATLAAFRKLGGSSVPRIPLLFPPATGAYCMRPMSAYPNLLSPLQIGSMTVRNRLLQTAHAKLFSHEGVDSQRNADYQVERARGGVGL